MQREKKVKSRKKSPLDEIRDESEATMVDSAERPVESENAGDTEDAEDSEGVLEEPLWDKETPREEAAPPSKSADPLPQYLKEIRRTPLLTFEEEQELAKRIAEGDEDARRKMIEANLRLVVKIGRRYLNKGMELSDIIEEGNIGLIKAVEKFKYEKGFKFNTYAFWWIRQAIERALINQTRMIRLPVYVVEIVNNFSRTVQRLFQKLNRDPTVEEIAREMGVSEMQVRDIFQLIQKTYSLDAPVGDKSDDTFKDIIKDERSATPEEQVDHVLLHEQVREWLGHLTDKEREVIILRFGLGAEDPQTLEKIGQQFGMTRERIRQIEAQALIKLRNLSRRKQIDLDGML